ncbi:MAG: malto-oligosyltrehalose trehalohydrolase [Succinivibrionaceae bacterium]
MKKLGYYTENNKAYFNIYAPLCNTLSVELDKDHTHFELEKNKDDYFYGEIPLLEEGELYWLVKNDYQYLPDPYSKRQPFNVHGASMITYPQKASFDNWKGIKAENAIIYELHIGTFTKDGTFKAATEKLQYLKSLGINVIEIMPIADFPGDRNWGYDGTFMFAINPSYGTNTDLTNFINEAHKLGIGVILDIVYNHFGPEGNYTGMLAPFTRTEDTPWGAAINFDSQGSSGIRDFYLYNTKYWISEIGFDGFRMDATSFIIDKSPKHILTEINELVQNISREENREIIMIAEHLRNIKNVTAEDGLKFNAQWCDDLSFSIISLLTKQKFRNYKDFGTISDVLKAFNEGFVYDGTKLNSVHNCKMGESGKEIVPRKIVSYIQNHDQIGNRPKGDRLYTSYGQDKTLLAYTILLASPYIPMIFMGDEYGELNPFYFFESFTDQWLIDAVNKARQEELEISDKDYKKPHDVETFIDSKIDWQFSTEESQIEILDFFKKLIALRKSGYIGNSDRAMNYAQIINDKVMIIVSNKSYVVCNLSDKEISLQDLKLECTNNVLLSSKLINQKDKSIIYPNSAIIYER